MFADNILINDLSKCLASIGNLITGGQNEELPLAGSIKESPATKRALLVALSGGPDSTALLLAAQTVAPSFNFAVHACHINHGLRAQESDKDADFCLEICKQLNIECEVICLNLSQRQPDYQRRYNEDTLRQLRYQQLQNYARQKNIAFVLTAHTLDDQSETILFRLFRGTALTGLTGIKVCRSLGDGFYLLRPLLAVSKEQCIQFLKSKQIAARHDSSNLDESYSRNYVRHTVMIAIKKRFPDFNQHLYSMRQVIADEDELLTRLTDSLLEKLQSNEPNQWPLEIVLNQPLALQRRAIASALRIRDIAVSFSRIEEILALTDNSQPLNLNQHWRIRRFQNTFIWEEISLPINENEIKNFDPVIVKVPGTNPISNLGIALSVEVYDGNGVEEGQALVDLSNIKPPLVLRLRQPGDIIHPLGMPGSVKLKKFLHTHKMGSISSEFTNAGILLADQEEVLWLPGRGLSEKIKVRESPSHRLQWLKIEDFQPIAF